MRHESRLYRSKWNLFWVLGVWGILVLLPLGCSKKKEKKDDVKTPEVIQSAGDTQDRSPQATFGPRKDLDDPISGIGSQFDLKQCQHDLVVQIQDVRRNLSQIVKSESPFGPFSHVVNDPTLPFDDGNPAVYDCRSTLFLVGLWGCDEKAHTPGQSKDVSVLLRLLIDDQVTGSRHPLAGREMFFEQIINFTEVPLRDVPVWFMARDSAFVQVDKNRKIVTGDDAFKLSIMDTQNSPPGLFLTFWQYTDIDPNRPYFSLWDADLLLRGPSFEQRLQMVHPKKVDCL